MRRSLLVALLLVLVVVSVPPAAAASYQPECRLDATSLALLSCQETSPQAPTRSCCYLLLDAIDTFPASPVDKGICCLCIYLLGKTTVFDLAAAYVSCGGKDAASVAAWMQQGPHRNCHGTVLLLLHSMSIRPVSNPVPSTNHACTVLLLHAIEPCGTGFGDDAPPPPPKNKSSKLSTACHRCDRSLHPCCHMCDRLHILLLLLSSLSRQGAQAVTRSDGQRYVHGLLLLH